MADIFSLLLANRRAQLMYQTLVALQQGWQLMCKHKISACPTVIERSITIVSELEQLATDIKIKHSLFQLRQRLEQDQTPMVTVTENAKKGTASINALLDTVDLSINTNQTPWLASASQAPLPPSLQTLGSAWRKDIQKSKNHPSQRLQLAIKMLPYSTAFSEAAIALRAILRQKPKQSEQLLKLLYWLAAIHSFLSIKEGTPSGDKVAAAITGTDILSLTINYPELGTEQLPLLTVTDKNRLHHNWGAPLQHQRLGDLNPQARKKYKQKLQL